jgi:hypothetical protein
LNETYGAIRERAGILERFDQQGHPAASGIQRKQKSRPATPPLLPWSERIVHEAESLKGAEPGVQRRALTVLRAAADLLRAAADEAPDWDDLTKQIRRTRTAVTQLERLVDREIWGE